MRENRNFVFRVMLIHVITYIVCGIIFSALFNYEELFQLGNTKYFMHPYDSSSSYIGMIVQVFRGLIFGFILLLLKDSMLKTRHGWLKLWALIVVIGIFNTPGPAPCSIEGIIYTQLPLELHLKGAPEILIQTLLFSFLVANPIKFKGNMDFINKNKIPFISACVSGVMFSLSGIILALIINADMMAGMTDIGAFIIMFGAIAGVYFICKWYKKTSFKLKHIIFMLFCYTVLAIAPTLYNYLTGSVFASLLTLVINIVPVFILFAINLKNITYENK